MCLPLYAWGDLECTIAMTGQYSTYDEYKKIIPYL